MEVFLNLIEAGLPRIRRLPYPTQLLIIPALKPAVSIF